MEPPPQAQVHPPLIHPQVETTSAKAYGNLDSFLWERMAAVPVTLGRCRQALGPALMHAPQESPLEPPQESPLEPLKLMKCHQPPHLKQHFLQGKN